MGDKLVAIYLLMIKVLLYRNHNNIVFKLGSRGYRKSKSETLLHHITYLVLLKGIVDLRHITFQTISHRDAAQSSRESKLRKLVSLP